ncbi:hypothetical protein [Thermogemmatispora carboxidivorans]|uniref:hypothetical protein n=1 Tax=Thermogemmatispora carboxidivorans TaxID=1382306 RepID=UPI0012DCD354|nr:hypothetical protein [Thermogemmatispora carboxidivorans]
MTIEEQWHGLSSQLGGRRLRLPTPPACLSLLERARQAGIQVGDLFVVSRPLVPQAQGGYELSTGRLWCHDDARLEEAERSLTAFAVSRGACGQRRCGEVRLAGLARQQPDCALFLLLPARRGSFAERNHPACESIAEAAARHESQ